MLAKLYTALKAAGASEAEAEAAAAEVAGYENRLAKIDSDVAVVKWMVGFNLAATTAMLFKMFS
ncbi:MAG: hypothetical protein NTAFB01_12970 [Nitrospira sp.]